MNDDFVLNIFFSLKIVQNFNLNKINVIERPKSSECTMYIESTMHWHSKSIPKRTKKCPKRGRVMTNEHNVNFSINFRPLWCSISLTYLFTYRLVFHQHLNLYICYPGNPLEPPYHTQGQFCTCHRSLFSDYSDQSLTTRSPDREFSTSITLALHLAQPFCASITKQKHHIWHHISNLQQ